MRPAAAVALALAVGAAATVGVWYARSPPATARKAGQAAPDLALRVLHGGHPSGIPLLGRTPLLLFFFDTRWAATGDWLKPMERIHRRFYPDGLGVIGIALDEDAAGATRFVEDKGFEFIVMHDPGGRASRAAYGPPSAPQAYLVDARGRVVKAFARLQDWDEPEVKGLVSALLAAASSAPAPSAPAR